jgi:hypothetical protein
MLGRCSVSCGTSDGSAYMSISRGKWSAESGNCSLNCRTNSELRQTGVYLFTASWKSAPPGPGSTIVAPSARRSSIARSTIEIDSESATVNKSRFMYSRTTPMRTPSSRPGRAKLAYGCSGFLPTLNAVSSSLGS